MNPVSDNVAIIALLAITAMMLKVWLSHREKMKSISASAPDRSVSDGRLERLEQAVESIAIEVERISEGQRYVTKLMSERARPLDQPPLTIQPRKLDTPH